MKVADTKTAPLDLPEELARRRRIVSAELQKRTVWFIRLRWWVPPGIVFGTIAAKWIGFAVLDDIMYVLAGFILAYNIGLYAMRRCIQATDIEDLSDIQLFTYLQVALDYGAMFLLVHFTGGAASPFIFFFIFHIIFASVLLPPRSVYAFAGLVTLGMAFLVMAEYSGWLPHHPLNYRGTAIDLAHQPAHLIVEILFFSASVFIAGIFTTSMMSMLRRRIVRLRELTDSFAAVNRKLESLYVLVQAIGSSRDLARVLGMVSSELAAVMNVQGISVKLLSDDAATLRYASAFGLPPRFRDGRVVDLRRSPLNRKLLEGESFVTGDVTDKDMFQFGEDLEEASIRSVLFVPMEVEGRAIGILGAYCRRPDRFNAEDIGFFGLAAGLVAIAIDNARAYERIERLGHDRSRFMVHMAHNLRAPLGAVANMLEVIRGGYIGDLNEEQQEYLRRIDRRAHTMLAMIGELMTLARQRDSSLAARNDRVDLATVAGRIERSFRDGAARKKIAFTVSAPGGLPPIAGDADRIEQMLENLVSNAVKYTPEGGKVTVDAFADNGHVKVEVTDTGIGIPSTAVPNLFTDFFRAENACAVEEVGTGLGLAIVKEIAEQHGGYVRVHSTEGSGSRFTVVLPAVAAKEAK